MRTPSNTTHNFYERYPRLDLLTSLSSLSEQGCSLFIIYCGTNERRFRFDCGSKLNLCFAVMALARPELVKSWKKPLSSDAFSNFGVDSAEEHETEALAIIALLCSSLLC